MNRLFPELLAPKLHPANVGHDFTREGAVTPALLELYRARAVRMSLFQDDMKGAMEGLHAIFRMGAKLICSAAAPTDMGDWEAPRQELMRFYIGLAKGEDPELIFDAFISWQIRPTVEYIPIPAAAFASLGMPSEDRCFDYRRMGEETERKLWYCCRGLQFLEAGFESLTFDRRIPEETADWFRDKALLVFHGGIPAADFAQEGEERITCRWIAEKQREG